LDPFTSGDAVYSLVSIGFFATHAELHFSKGVVHGILAYPAELKFFWR
jgi:hypothetical protein